MTQQKYSDYQYLLAYALFIGAMMLFVRTRFGYVTTYYALAMLAFTLLLLRSAMLVDILKPIAVQQ